MNDRTISISELQQLYNSSIPALDSVVDDLAAIRDAIESLDPMLPSFDRSQALSVSGSLVQAQANHLFAAATALASVAVTWKTLGQVVAHSLSQSPRPVDEPQPAKAVKKARGRKR